MVLKGVGEDGVKRLLKGIDKGKIMKWLVSVDG